MSSHHTKGEWEGMGEGEAEEVEAEEALTPHFPDEIVLTLVLPIQNYERSLI